MGDKNYLLHFSRAFHRVVSFHIWFWFTGIVIGASVAIVNRFCYTITGMVIDGKKIADEILARLKLQLKPKKFLAAVLISGNEASVSFLKQKERVAKELGVDFRLYEFPAEIVNDELRRKVREITEHKTCGGVIVQLPLSEHLNKHYILNVIPREKDVDVLGERALGAFYTGRNPVLPPALGTVEEIFKALDVRCEMFKVAVVGAGFLVGKVIVTWFLGKVRELYVLDKGSDFRILKEVDIVISGVGEAGLINASMLKPGALVIDFGYDRGRGDFDSEKSRVEDGPLAFTPTPGGTGPILVAKIFENFYMLNSEK